MSRGQLGLDPGMAEKLAGTEMTAQRVIEVVNASGGTVLEVRPKARRWLGAAREDWHAFLRMMRTPDAVPAKVWQERSLETER